MGGYERYGISRDLVERVKGKIKQPATKEQVKLMLHNVSKEDLQDRLKVKRLLTQAARLTNERIPPAEAERIVDFIVKQRIDPSKPIHLIRLWSLFH
ncbi:MAG: serine/threonine protein kinase [Paenibacillaceae bacterium]|jgi:hypothetical protein|nr:serine/threonine protein kinase [Paenibacillaceae bacterium]